MKTLIAYATKNGYTKQCAEKLRDLLGGDADLADLKRDKPDLSQYDTVVAGGSVYAGRIRKEVTRFCAKNLGELKKKRFFLFACAMADGEEGEKQLRSVFAPEVFEAAAEKVCFGGEYIFQKMSGLERFIIKKIAGSDEDKKNPKDENIQKMAEAVKGA